MEHIRQEISYEMEEKDVSVRWTVCNLSVLLNKLKLTSKAISLPFTEDVAFSVVLEEDPSSSANYLLRKTFNNRCDESNIFWYKLNVYRCEEKDEKKKLSAVVAYKSHSMKAREVWEDPSPMPLAKSSVVKADGFDIVIQLEVARQRENVYSDSCGEIERSISGAISKMYQTDQFKDIKFVFGEDGKKSLLAHRAIIAARSDVFLSMLTHDTKEKQEGVIRLKDTRSDVFKSFLKYLYTNEIDNIEQFAMDLVMLAEKYNVPCLKIKCEKYLCQTIDEKNAICNLIVSDLNHCHMLKDHTLYVIRTHFERIENDETFKLLYDYPSLMHEIFKSVCYKSGDDKESKPK